MNYTVEWQELVYDGFDDLEGINGMPPFTIQASSWEEAETRARDEARCVLSEKRKEDVSTGTFIPHLVALTDERGARHRLARRQVWGAGGFFITNDPQDVGN